MTIMGANGSIALAALNWNKQRREPPPISVRLSLLELTHGAGISVRHLLACTGRSLVNLFGGGKHSTVYMPS
jgi:hypothetical protein